MPESISLLLWQNEVEAACQLRGHKRVVEDLLSGASESRNALIWLFGNRLRWLLLVGLNFSNRKQEKKRTEIERSHPEDGKASRCFKEHATEHHRSRTCASGLQRLSDTLDGGKYQGWVEDLGWAGEAALVHVMPVTRPNDTLWIRRPEVPDTETFPSRCLLQSPTFSSSALELLEVKREKGCSHWCGL